MFKSVSRLKLANLPTPLESAPKLAAHLGLDKMLIKRDDLTGLAMGGNKARKLEFELARVVAEGYDTIITVGGQQSNHARMTAAAARKLGMDIKLVLGGADFTELKGNLLLDTLFGAEIRYINGSDDDDDLETLQLAWRDELEAAGKKPYALPLGGSTPRGTMGYVLAMQELALQLDDDHVQIFLPVGSCGTLAGVLLGSAVFLPNAEIYGISVSRTKENIISRTVDLAKATAEMLCQPAHLCQKQFHVYDCYHEEYAKHIKIARDAADECAMLEGLIVDQIYTGKAMAGLFDLARKGVLRRDHPVIFLHTGGMPEIFAETMKYGDYPGCKKFTPEEVREMKK